MAIEPTRIGNRRQNADSNDKSPRRNGGRYTEASSTSSSGEETGAALATTIQAQGTWSDALATLPTGFQEGYMVTLSGTDYYVYYTQDNNNVYLTGVTSRTTDPTGTNIIFTQTF